MLLRVALLALLLALAGQKADAQQIVLPCVPSGNSCTPVSAANPLPVTGSSAATLAVGTSTITSGTNTFIEYNNSGVLGEYPITGSGNVVMSTSPTLVTPTLGVAAGTSLALGGCTLGSNAFCVTGLGNFASVGSSSAPTLSIGNQTTGFYSVSTTGIGIAVNGVLIGDYGISTGSFWTLSGSLVLGGQSMLLGGGVATLSRNGGTGALTINSNASNIILTPAATTALTLSATTVTWGSATYASCTALTTSGGAMGCTASDARLKLLYDVLDPKEALAFAENVAARFFSFKDPSNPFSDDRRHIGYLAQDVNHYAPHIASAMVRMMAPTDLTPDGTLALDYDQPGVIALSAVSALKHEFDVYKRSHP